VQAFRSNQLDSVTIPNSVTSILPYTFSNNQLTSVTIPKGVKIIWDYAFSNNQLTSVTIPDSVWDIRRGAFSNNQLTSVTIPFSVESVSGFDNNQLTSVTISFGVSNISVNAFENNQLTSVTLPDSVQSIGEGAFRRNQLTSAAIGDGVSRIWRGAFSSNQLTSVTLPDNMKSIGPFAFTGNQLSYITIPDGVTEIGAYAFASNKLTSVTIPNRVKEIGPMAFENNQLSYVLIKADLVGSFGYWISPTIFWGNSNLDTIEASADASGWDGMSFSNGTRLINVTLEIPTVPQQSLSKIIRTDGKATDSTISIGSSSDNGETYSTLFTIEDEVILTAEIYPDSNDVGEEGELYIVIRNVRNGEKVFSALNEDGVWEVWKGSLKARPAAKYVGSLESVEEIKIYSGTLTTGQRLIYVGYSLFTDGKPVITTSLSPLKIDVSE